jgi:hypothetical protein
LLQAAPGQALWLLLLLQGQMLMWLLLMLLLLLLNTSSPGLAPHSTPLVVRPLPLSKEEINTPLSNLYKTTISYFTLF